MSHQKIIVLSGCSRGLGRSLVEQFIAAGHRVHGSARSRKVIDSLNDHYADHGSFSVVDVSNESEVATWSQQVLKTDGPPDIVINNAGVINEPLPLWQVPGEEFQRLVNINIMGVHHVLSHFLEPMIKRRSGVIVNLSSGWGRSVSAEVAPYCASKWAIEGLSKALAEELPTGMASIPLSPGVIDTDMLRQAWGEGAGSYRKPDDWARQAAPFILSLGPQHNGQSLTTPG
ncbi:MAG: SDR family oxidoreductase [Granulosicoccus sp.]